MKMAYSISTPIALCADRLIQLAKGDLKSPIPTINSNDETGLLVKATESITNTLNEIILDINNGLDEMSNGNFNFTRNATDYYVGDFAPITLSMDKIVHSLSTTLSQIKTASEQVNIGSEQVSSGAQSLAQGATEQASSIEMLADTLIDISEQIKNTAEYSSNAKEATDLVNTDINHSNEQMRELTTAMSDIENKSKEISKIIKAIDDIAFQTNILALNAAVEAARAGAAGKGFAVVADEVRNLAGKSAAAAKSTAMLIDETVDSISTGTKVVSATATSLLSVVEKTENVTILVDNIAQFSNKQSEAIDYIRTSMDQISSVIQTNSATSEESAASSEELSSQAAIMTQLVEAFTLKNIPWEDKISEIPYVVEPKSQTYDIDSNSKY